MSAWFDIVTTLRIARDCAECGRPWEALKLACDVAPDFRYVKRRARKEHPRPYFDTGDARDEYAYYDDDEDAYEPEPLIDQRRRIAAEWKRIDWLAWRPVSVFDGVATTYSDMLRIHYTPESIEAMANQPSIAASLLAMTEATRAGLDQPNVAYMNPRTYQAFHNALADQRVRDPHPEHGSDGYTARIRSWANLVNAGWMATAEDGK